MIVLIQQLHSSSITKHVRSYSATLLTFTQTFGHRSDNQSMATLGEEAYAGSAPT